MIRRAANMGSKPHVCVVGAGMAGLRCADVLSRKGIRVTILEGRSRYGGRIHQSDKLGHLVDLGPNWIHPAEDNEILNLAEKLKDTTFSPQFGDWQGVYDEDGSRLDATTARNHSDVFWDLINEAFPYSKDNCENISPEVSLMDHLRIKVLEKTSDKISSKIILQMASMWGDYVGESIETQSLKYFWLEDCLDGENLFLASTYKAILDHVAKRTLAAPLVELKYSTKATSIETKASAGSKPRVYITTDTKTTIECDEVVMTAPLGWLKKNLSAFSPPLPQPMTKAIDHIGYGRLEKVYVTFPSSFWLSNPPNPNTRTPDPFFTQFLSPNYAPNPNPQKWTLECVSLAHLPPPHSHPTLLFYINGDVSHHITTSLHHHSTPPATHTFLTHFFHPYYSRLPNYHASSPSCQPTTFLSTDWQHDDLAGCGSYTLFQTSDPATDGTVELDVDIANLTQGCPERGLWFAGEHTAPFDVLGTVTGAYRSGSMVAERIGGFYGLDEGGEEGEGAFRGGGWGGGGKMGEGHGGEISEGSG